jgi:hypothetical protein
MRSIVLASGGGVEQLAPSGAPSPLGRTPGVDPDEALPSAVPHGPLASPRTVYETPDGRRCIVTFANRGAVVLSPVRNARGELWVGYLLDDGTEPAGFDDWERGWVPPELLRPIGEPDRP